MLSELYNREESWKVNLWHFIDEFTLIIHNHHSRTWRKSCTHLDAAPRQRPMSHGSLHQSIFGRKKHSCGSLAPHSPDLSPCDFFLFLRLKNHLKGRHFGTLDNIQKSVTDELKGILAEAFQHCYEQWKQRLRRCVAAQGNYFEGENLDL